MNNSTSKHPHPLLAAIPLVVMAVLLYITIGTFGSDALNGGSQIVLLSITALTSVLAISFCRVSWQHIESAICKNVHGVSGALIILLLIGALSGSWMLSGVVPTLIYYGMQIISPSTFLVSCCIISAVVSLMTGSSWTTIATIGIALMGIGTAQGFAPGWVAGAIISGAYFGDKISPLSDTTVLASSVTGTPLFSHIRYMMYTTVPSFVIALTIFTVAGLNHTTDATEQIAAYTTALNRTFHISPWLLLVPIITGILIARKVPSIITLFASAAMAGLCAVIAQPELLQSVAGESEANAHSLFKGLFMTYYGSTGIDTGNESLNSLVATRGMSGMLNTIWLILCAMCFGGAMQASGMLESLTSVFLRFIKKGTDMVASTVFSGLFLNVVTADQYISIILTGSMYKDIYHKKGYDSSLLSRTTEDAVTVTSVLIPWNSCGMTQATVLGVPTLTYLPYTFFNLICPLMSIVVMAIGYKIKRLNEPEKVETTEALATA